MISPRLSPSSMQSGMQPHVHLKMNNKHAHTAHAQTYVHTLHSERGEEVYGERGENPPLKSAPTCAPSVCTHHYDQARPSCQTWAHSANATPIRKGPMVNSATRE
jgi:hypothetical protein